MVSLSLLVHGEPGTGKSWLGGTTPTPRLILDVEGGTQWIPGNKVYWDPSKGAPPPVTDDTCVATIKSFQALGIVMQWLTSGKHPFKSVVVDSISELQKRAMDSITGTDAAQQQDWGTLLRKMEGIVRALRDLTISNGIQAIDCVMIIAGSQVKDGITRPHLQGQLGSTIMYYFDVCGYLYLKQDEDGNVIRSLLTAPLGNFAAKDRTGQFGTVVNSPNIAQMLSTLEVARNGG